MTKSIIKTIKNVLYYLVIALLLIVIVISISAPNKLIDIVGYSWYKVVSGSMEPKIMTNDFIVAKKLDDIDSLENGDIIIFETIFYQGSNGYQKGIVTHYFGYITEEGYIKTYPHKEFGKNPEDITYDVWFDGVDGAYDVLKTDVIGVHVETITAHNLPVFLNYLVTTPLGFVMLSLTIVGVSYIVYVVVYDKKKDQDEK